MKYNTNWTGTWAMPTRTMAHFTSGKHAPKQNCSSQHHPPKPNNLHCIALIRSETLTRPLLPVTSPGIMEEKAPLTHTQALSPDQYARRHAQIASPNLVITLHTGGLRVFSSISPGSNKLLFQASYKRLGDSTWITGFMPPESRLHYMKQHNIY